MTDMRKWQVIGNDSLLTKCIIAYELRLKLFSERKRQGGQAVQVFFLDRNQKYELHTEFNVEQTFMNSHRENFDFF